MQYFKFLISIPRKYSVVQRAAGLVIAFFILLGAGCPPSSTPPPPGQQQLRVPSHASRFLTRRESNSDPRAYYRNINATGDTLTKFRQRNGFNAVPEVNAVYFNGGDLNLGRGMHCVQNNDRVACYVSNFGLQPGQAGFPDPSDALTKAIAGTAPFATVAMETAIDPTRKIVTVNERDGATNKTVTQCPLTGNDGPPSGNDVDTGIDIYPGDVVEFSATGNLWAGVCLTGQNFPDGWNTIENSPDFPLPGNHPFSLIGRVGNSDYFFIGSNLGYTHQGREGRLSLRTNDDMPGNGTGAFSTSITVTRQVRFYVYDLAGDLVNNAALDSEGQKPVPGLCLSCHGGRYDSQTDSVMGASFLPFDVFSFVFSDQPGFTLSDQQENFRKLNSLVKKTKPAKDNPHNPIEALIDGLYPGGVDTPNATAGNTYVPPGWQQQPSVYNVVIKPYCRTCHVAVGELLDWTSTNQFRQAKFRIEAAICGSHDMPHAEVPFLKFWTSSPVYVPGYLEDPSVLGLTNCAQK